MPGKFKEKVIGLKRMHNVSTNTLAQSAIAHFLQNGRYELHLRHLRKALHTQSLRYLQAISEYFPEDIRITRPHGGFVLWIELNKRMIAISFINEHLNPNYALEMQSLPKGSDENIGIAPGQLFSSQGQFHNYFRLCYGAPWSEKIDKGLKMLGKLVRKY